MNFHSMSRAHDWLRRYISKNPKATFRRLFQLMRKRKELEIYGDWVLISEIVQTSKSVGIIYTFRDVTRVCRQSTDSELKRVRRDSKIVCNLLDEV